VFSAAKTLSPRTRAGRVLGGVGHFHGHPGLDFDARKKGRAGRLVAVRGATGSSLPSVWGCRGVLPGWAGGNEGALAAGAGGFDRHSNGPRPRSPKRRGGPSGAPGWFRGFAGYTEFRQQARRAPNFGDSCAKGVVFSFAGGRFTTGRTWPPARKRCLRRGRGTCPQGRTKTPKAWCTTWASRCWPGR